MGKDENPVYGQKIKAVHFEGLKKSHSEVYGGDTALYLVGGLEHFSFSRILGIVIPIDELIFFRRVGQPPARYILVINHSS